MADVDAILATGAYTDRRGTWWGLLKMINKWADLEVTRLLTPAQMRELIERDMHRGECPGLSACEGHPVPHVARHDRRLWHACPPHGVASNLYRTFGAALDAARNTAGETP